MGLLEAQVNDYVLQDESFSRLVIKEGMVLIASI